MSRVRCVNDFEWDDPEPEGEASNTPVKKPNTLPWLVDSKLFASEPLVPMVKYDIHMLNRSTIHKEFLHVKYCVISAEYLFNKLYHKCVKIQLDTFGYDDAEFKSELAKWLGSKRYRRHNPKPEKKRNSHIYTNNYVIFVDTVFRMVTLFDRYIKNMKKYRCEAEHIVLINDISWTSIPKCRMVYDFGTKTFCTREKIAWMMIRQLHLISETFRNCDLDEFETFNTYLMKAYPEMYHIDYFHPRGKVSSVTEEGREKIRKRMMDLAALLQMQLSMKEVYLAWMMVFDVLSKRKGITAFTMIEPWGKRNVPKLVLEHQYTESNRFVGGNWVGVRDRHAGKIDNVNAMNALGDWRQFKCKYIDLTGQNTTSAANKGVKSTNTNSVKSTNTKDSNVKGVAAPMRTQRKRAMTPTNKMAPTTTPKSSKVSTLKSTGGKRKKFTKTIGINKCEPRRRAQTVKPTPKPYIAQHYWNDSDVFNFNIIHIFNTQKCLFITRKFVPYTNVFYFKSKAPHYPIMSKKYHNCELDTSTKLVKYVPHNRTLLSCFDDINRECAERVLDLNDSLRVMLFDDMKALYVDDTVGEDVVRPDRYSEWDYSWITREMAYEFMPNVIVAFNKHFKTDVV